MWRLGERWARQSEAGGPVRRLVLHAEDDSAGDLAVVLEVARGPDPGRADGTSG